MDWFSGKNLMGYAYDRDGNDIITFRVYKRRNGHLKYVKHTKDVHTFTDKADAAIHNLIKLGYRPLIDFLEN